MKLRKARSLYFLLPLILLLSSFYVIPNVYGSGLLAGFTPEFMGRSDGNLGLKKKYHLNMRTVVISDAVMYKAAFEKQLDVISGYSTDGRLKAYDLVTLKDDKNVFPPYFAAPIVREEVLKQYPELEGVLNLLSGHINDSIMTELNYKADYLHQSPERIAKDFLAQQGLYKPARNGKKGTIRIGSKIFGEQYILGEMYAMLIKGYSDLDVAAKTGLGGTKICFDAMTNNQIDFYVEYTGTGLLVILKPDQQAIDKIVQNRDSVYNFVQSGFQEQFHIKWLKPIGFNNTYALMMRKRASKQLNINTTSDLARYVESSH